MRRYIRSEAARTLGVTLLGIATMIVATLLLDGCAGLSADDRYRARIFRCVDEAKTLAESKACRAQVDTEFGVVDGGVNDH